MKVVLAAIAFVVTIGCTNNIDPLQTALDSFQLEPGLRIELIASEPMVIDPVAIAFDEDRRMYVVENRGYPDPAEGGAPTKLGRVARLEDSNGDGNYDRRTEFASGFTYPNGVLPWKGGVFVTCAPEIFYLKDTDGDGVADIRKVVLTGFNDTKTAQIRMSSPILGLDGWVYVAGGLNGGEVTSPEHPDRPAVSYTTADGRFHPETLEFEVTGGKSQYGLTFDAYGRRFGCSNRHPLLHIVLEPWHLRRNPNLPFTETIQNVSKVESEAQVFPISDIAITADFMPSLIGRSHTGTFTSACGLLAYNGVALSSEHQGNVFICEPAQNLVQRQVIYPDGASFRSELPYEGREFLSSTDTWFNPVFLQHGPEDALYVVDMHRKVIDHPSYVPEVARKNLDFVSGKEQGRIFRVVREDFRDDPDGSSRLSSNSNLSQIVNALKSSKEWERATAHRLLLERRDFAGVPLLQEVATNGTLPESRTRALWLLHALESLDVATLKQAFADQEAGVREQGTLLAQELSEEHSELLRTLTSAAKDEDPRVRFNTALTLGSQKESEVITTLAEIAAQDGANHWARAAVLSGIGTQLPEFLAAFRHEQAVDSAAFTAVMQDLGRLFGNGAPLADCRNLLLGVLSEESGDGWQVATVLGLAKGFSGRAEINGSLKNPLYELLSRNASKAERTALDKFVTQVIDQAEDLEVPISRRVMATTLLGYTDFERSGNVMQRLLDAKSPPELQLAAVEALTRQGNTQGGALLTEKDNWVSYSPQVRSAVVASLVLKPAFTEVLFSAIEQDVVEPSNIPSADRQRLMNNKNPEIRAQAKRLFNELVEGGRMQVYEDYRQTINPSADGAMGEAVFRKACSACHNYAGEGGNVGPDLNGVKNQPAEALLLHTLVPNYEVYPAYQAVLVETSDGRSLSGRLLAETENSLTLRTTFGTDESILRANITSLTNTGRSLMPEGLEQSMTEEELSQLIAYLKSGG